ncbi:MAG: ribulose-phosphate 3-epimerase [Candidatus Ornithospirochaeta sp.]
MDIYPSIASSDPLMYGETLKSLDSWPFLHIDIEDGNFTPNITFGLKTVEAVISASKAKAFSVHLMVTNPMDYLEELKNMGVGEVFAHIEALDKPDIFISSCHNMDMKAGLALKANTPFSSIEKYLSQIDSILFLTSCPNPIKEEFSLSAFNRAIDVAARLKGKIPLTADGGLGEEEIKMLEKTGFDSVVLGRLVFIDKDPLMRIKKLTEIIGDN